MSERVTVLDESVCVCDENVWETGAGGVERERVCVSKTEACDENVWETVAGGVGRERVCVCTRQRLATRMSVRVMVFGREC